MIPPLGARLPSLVVPPPGPASRALARRLRAVESRNVTFLDDDFPVFWEEAAGANVLDADGNVYLDLTSAFGVALPGHGHPRILEAVESQARRLVHGMGDVHPPAAKVDLMERLAALAPWPQPRCVLASTGSEAVEIALKTALMATGRPGILAFEGGYHGLTLGALAATARPWFRQPFVDRLYPGVRWAPFPGHDGRGAGSVEESLAAVDRALAQGAPEGDGAGQGTSLGPAPIGAIILEPVQGRGGIRIPPPAFTEGLVARARAHGALVIADEIFTGMGRSGRVLASDRVRLAPDILCLGKTLGGGLPLSACLAPAEIMDAWPPSPGEAIHTSTFLGHPLACAAGLAVLDLVDEGLPEAAEAVGARLGDALTSALTSLPGVLEVRRLGAMIGVELDRRESDGGAPAAELAVRLLREGILVLPAGDEGEVLELAPPTCLTEAQSELALEKIVGAVEDWGS